MSTESFPTFDCSSHCTSPFCDASFGDSSVSIYPFMEKIAIHPLVIRPSAILSFANRFIVIRRFVISLSVILPFVIRRFVIRLSVIRPFVFIIYRVITGQQKLLNLNAP